MKDWKWYGHAMHFICSDQCYWHMATELPNGLLVSSVGDMKPDDIGIGHKYETMVFRINGRLDCGCPEISGLELAARRYDTHSQAAAGHIETCLEWSEKKRRINK